MALTSDARVKNKARGQGTGDRGGARAADVALTAETPDEVAVRTLNGVKDFDEEGETGRQ
jgi:hypothetical protein